MFEMGSETVGGPPELGVHVTIWRSEDKVRMPSFFLYSVRPAGRDMMLSRGFTSSRADGTTTSEAEPCTAKAGQLKYYSLGKLRTDRIVNAILLDRLCDPTGVFQLP